MSKFFEITVVEDSSSGQMHTQPRATMVRASHVLALVDVSEANYAFGIKSQITLNEPDDELIETQEAVQDSDPIDVVRVVRGIRTLFLKDDYETVKGLLQQSS